MFSPAPLSAWHLSAGRIFADQFGIAATQADRHSQSVGYRLLWQGPRPITCYPSLPLRSGPSQTGSPLPCCRQSDADEAGARNFPFESVEFALKSVAIKNATRGSILCANPLSSSLFSLFRFRPACRTQPRAASPVRRLAPLSPTRWMKTWSLARRSAVLPVLHLAASRSACRPATDLIPAYGQGVLLNHGVVRTSRPGGPISFALRLAAPAC